MQVSTRVLVFSAIKYAESDLIVSCFTEDYGLKSYLLRGIRKSRKGKLRASLFQPLTQLQLEAYHKDRGTLERISEAKVLYPYQTVHTDVVKSSVVMFLAEVLKSSIQEEEANPMLFEYISNSLRWLDLHDRIANFPIFFLLNLSAHLGFYPDTSHSHYPYFNLLEGNFQSEPYGDYCETGEVVETLKGFFGINFDTIEQKKTTKIQRLEALNLILKYYQLHLQTFKKPKSLSVLNQLFN